MPDWKEEITRQLRSLKLAPAREAEIVEEVAQHLEDRHKELLSGGATEAEARRVVLEELSAKDFLERGLRRVEQEVKQEPIAPGEEGRSNFLASIGQDIRFGLRMLRKNPTFTAIGIITLALGIGANTAVFTLIDSVMLRPLPVRDPRSLVVLRWSAHRWPNTNSFYGWSGCPIKATGLKEPAPAGCSFSFPMFEQVRAENNIFTAVFAFVPTPLLGVSIDGNASFAGGEFVSGEFFPALGVRAALGRLLGPSDDGANASPAMVLSYSYWKRQFGGAPSVIGKSIVVNGVPFTVVGVGPPGFLGLDPGIVQDVWLPLSAQARLARYVPQATDAASWWLLIGARVKPRVTTLKAQAATELVFTRGVTSGPSPMWKLEDAPHIELVSVAHGLVSLRKRLGDPLFLLMAAVGLVLLVAFINMATLTLGRTAEREKELAIRFALGAERWRIFRQLLTETFIMAAAGGSLGMLLAFLGASSLGLFYSANWYSRLEINIHPDVRVLGFTTTVATVTGILFGLAPALRSTRIGVAPALKESAVSPLSTTSTGRRFVLGDALVVAQVALSILVLVGASLLVRTLINLATMHIGFDARNVIIFGVQPELNDYKGERLASLFPELQRRLGAVPGVASVGYSALPLLSGAYSTQDIYFASEPDRSSQVDVLNVGPSFFETMRIPLLGGRTYNSKDFQGASLKKAKVVIVNQSFAWRFFGKRNPIGQLIGLERAKSPEVEIVGVVGDAKYNDLRQGIEPTIYFPMRPGGGTFEVRTAHDPKALLSLIRDAVRSVDSNLPIFHLMTQAEQIDLAMFQERLVAWLSGAFALLALVVACIGLYGLLSFEVTRRTHEVGVRMALGASRMDVLGLVLGRGVRLVGIGAAAGIGTALGLTRYLRSLLYEVRPIDPLAYAAVTVLLLTVTMGACFVPARRATKVDPMVALRYE